MEVKMNIQDYNSAKIEKENITKDDFDEIKKTKEFQDIERDYGGVVEDFINNYADKSEPELMQDLLRLIAQKKKEGTFDAQKLRDLAKVIAPMLDDDARAKMFGLLNFLD